jgi:hypothetical protein
MLLRISLILAILAGIGTIVVTQLQTRAHLQSIIVARNNFETEKNKQTVRADKSEKDLASTRQLLNQTKDTLAKTEENLNGAQQALATAQENLGKARAEQNKAVEERKAAQAELAKWESLHLKPEEIQALQANLQKAKDAIAALEDEKRILSRQIAELDNRIKILIGADYEVPLPAGTKGNVLAVDPKWNFVILDLGKDKGMLEGGVLMVHRQSHLVGKVRIREVMDTRCVANMMPGWRLGEIEEGDQVLY